MFEILKDLNASVESLSTAYVEAIAFEEKLASERTGIHRRLLELQVDSFSSGTNKKLQSLKQNLSDIDLRLESLEFGREQLKTRIGERLQMESQERLKKIETELLAVTSEERKLQEAFLDSAARTAVIRESIRGLTLSHDTRGNYQTSTPSLEVKLNLMDISDGQFYSDQVVHYRKELQVGDFSRSITGRRSLLTDEQTSLGKMLAADPLQNAQELLDKLCPSASEPEEVAEPPKSHPSYDSKAFVKDYDKIAVDYEEGKSLPFKGINEVLRDRANS